MARDAAGWEWGHAKQLREQRKRNTKWREYKEAERKAASIQKREEKHKVAELREQERYERVRQRHARMAEINARITRALEATWNLGGKLGPTFYIYLLERLPLDPADKVRYVGVTDDPKRRYLEHRRCGQHGRLGNSDFRMVIVGEIRFEKKKVSQTSEHKPRSGLYHGNPINPQQVRKAEKYIADRYRAKGFELVNAD